jgi:hypothetical protein
VRAGRGGEVPISFSAEVQRPLIGSSDGRDVVVAAGLEQKNCDVGVSAKRAAATDPDDPDPQTMKS